MMKKVFMMLGASMFFFYLIFLIFFSKNLNLGLLGIIIIGSCTGILVSGIVNIPPRHVLIIRNKFTGELIPKPPGLQWIFPVRDEILKIHDCRPIVEPPTGINAITKDAQKVKLMIQRSYWIDALKASEDRFKPGGKGENRAILATIKLSGTKKQEIIEEIKNLIENISESHLKRFVSQSTIDDLEEDRIPESFLVRCPRCGTELKAEKEGNKVKFPEYCPNEKCDAKWNKKEKKVAIPQSLLALISWAVSVWSDYDLAEGFGIGCEIRVLNLMPPGELADAKLAEQVAEAQQRVQEAKRKIKEIESKTLKKFYEDTQIHPQIIYLIDRAVNLGEKIIDLFKKEKKEGGEK